MCPVFPHTRASRPWQLPDGIDELLPDACRAGGALRRACSTARALGLPAGHAAAWSNSRIRCSSGVGEDLDLLTFKVPDQLSGRMLGCART
jgi:ATP phosphoribosyltransferase regulatory subunit